MKKTMFTLAAAIAAVGAAQADTLVINSFGGAYEEAHRACIIDDFEAQTGATVEIVTAYSADAFTQVRAQRNSPQFDVIHFSGGQEIVAAEEGLLDPITEDMVPNLANLYDFAKEGAENGIGPAYQITTIGMIHNTELMDFTPTSWKDFERPGVSENLVLTDITNVYGLLGFLMLNQVYGGDLDDIQPGLDAVSQMLDDGAIVVSTSPEIQQEFAQNDAWIAPYAQDYAHTLTSAGLPVAFNQASEGTPASYITVNLVAGRSNQELASEFIDMTLSPDAQACFAEALRYAPTNAETRLSGEVAESVAYGPSAMSGLIRFDPQTIEANRSDWMDRWRRTISQ